MKFQPENLVHEENLRKAYTIRWLEFEAPNPQLKETFGALRELFADASVTDDERREILDKWIDRSWRMLEPWGDHQVMRVFKAAKVLGLVTTQAARTKYGSG